MRSYFLFGSFAFLTVLLISGSPAQAQVTDDFEGTYASTAADDFTGVAAPGWAAWTESSGWGGGSTLSELTPGFGSAGSSQRISVPSGSGGIVKSFSVTPGKYIRISIWLKTSTTDGGAQSGGWIEYGYDPNGSTADPSGVLWHADEPDSPKNNLGTNFNTWTQYTIPDLKVQQAPGGTISVWLKAGSGGGGGMRADFDDLTVEELDVPPGGPTPAAFPDNFDGTYVAGLAPDWFTASLPGGSNPANYAEATPGRGGAGSAQRMYTLDRKMGAVKLFNAPALTNMHLSVWAQTATADGGSPFDPGDGDIQVGFDPTGQILNMGAGTIVWDNSIAQAGSIPFQTWTQFEGPTFFLPSGQDTVSVWLRVDGGFTSPGARADFDDLELVVEGVISGARDWELYR
jgi:hypothetical protein